MVDLKPKKIIYRQPRKARTQPYQKVNAYSQIASKQQIATFIVFLFLLIVHEVFITPEVSQVDQAILWTIFGFRYALMILIAYDYILLTVFDPVDLIIIDQTLRYKFSPKQLRQCSLCATTVKCSSHHCMTCNRCTQEFDHHCKYLNNCIGVRNYQYFIRLLIVFTLYGLLGIGIGLWVVIQNQKNQYITVTRKWIIIAYICLSGLVTGIVTSLLAFHLYISCCANISTLQFVTAPEKYDQRPTLNYVVVEPTPLSAEHFRKTLQDELPEGNIPQTGNIPLTRVNKNNQQNNQPMQYYRK